MNKVPCKGCTARHAECYAQCEAYKAFAAENEEKKKLKISGINFSYADYVRARRTELLRERKRTSR